MGEGTANHVGSTTLPASTPRLCTSEHEQNEPAQFLLLEYTHRAVVNSSFKQWRLGLLQGGTANHLVISHLFISEHQQNGLAQFVLVEHAVQLIPCGVDAVSVIRVHDKDQSLCVLVVVPPQRTDLVLPPDVPNCSQQAESSQAGNIHRGHKHVKKNRALSRV